MKKFLKITFSLLVIFILVLGFALPLNLPPGWFQQTLPRSDILLTDIFFINVSTGWAIGNKFPSGDTAFIFKTMNGGNNWLLQNQTRGVLNVIQFLDINTGYVGGGGNGTVFVTLHKTTNSGINWMTLNNLGGIQLNDLYFVNKDTGWVCDNESFLGAGLQKTTNGGLSWLQQLPRTYESTKLFFLNKDTGWMGGSLSSTVPPRELYRTTNGGTNWTLLYTFPEQFFDMHFFNINVGVATTASFNQRTINGGLNWVSANEPGSRLSFVNDSVGWAGYGANLIMKTRNGGQSWYRQPTPISNDSRVFAIDTAIAWAGGSGIIHTTDGGGPVGIHQIGTTIPSDYFLFQNYPNPFNPVTNIKYHISKSSKVKLIIYDINGKEITNIVNQSQSAGIYDADWNASGYSSGVYFYSLIVNEKAVDTKKMILVK